MGTRQASGQVPPLWFLPIRNSVVLNEDIEDRIIRVYAAAESTFAVVRWLLLQFSTHFLISIMGYSGAGKSHTMLSQDGVIAAA